MLSPGPIVFSLYKLVIAYFPETSLTIYEQKTTVSVILATFAFTMLGFLAAIMALMLSSSGSQTFAKYQKKGYLDIFFFDYYLVVVSLIITFIFSILSLTGTHGEWMLYGAIIFTINNLVQICILTFMILSMASKSMRPSATD
jgi:hypothetical protein